MQSAIGDARDTFGKGSPPDEPRSSLAAWARISAAANPVIDALRLAEKASGRLTSLLGRFPPRIVSRTTMRRIGVGPVRAITGGEAVTEFEPAGQAADEVRALWAYVSVLGAP